MEHPKRKETPWSDSLDYPAKAADDTTFIPIERLTEAPTDGLPALGPMLEARAALLEDPRQTHVLRARYLTDSPVKLKVLADGLGISDGRVHQLEQQAARAVGAMLPQSTLEELAEFYLGN